MIIEPNAVAPNCRPVGEVALCHTMTEAKIPQFLLGVDMEPMEVKSVEAPSTGPGRQFEPKWDGFRCLVFKAGMDVDLRAKSGKSLSSYLPEMLDAARAVNMDNVAQDGELTVPRGDALSFGALEDRLSTEEQFQASAAV